MARRSYLNGGGQRTGADAGDGLHANGVNCERHQIADGRQEVVIHHLRVPRRYRLAAVGRVIHFVSLQAQQ